MSGEAENKMEVDGEPQEVLEVARDPSPESFKDKYKTLKDRLKYLVYEHECFEVEVQHAQAKLLELTHDKSYLLDQLMRYEPVLLSDDEERDDLTDISASEDEQMYSDPLFGSQPSPAVPPTVKSSGTPTPSATPLSSNSAPQPASRQAISKSAPIAKATKRQAKTKVNSGMAVKIAKTVSRARQTTAPKPPARSQITASRVKSPKSLVVSLPRNPPPLQVSSQGVVSTNTLLPLPDSSHDPQSNVQQQITNHTTTTAPTLPTPPLLTSSKVTLPTSTLGALPSSSSSSSTSSSGESDTDESTSSSSETRNGQSVDRDTHSPVQLVSEATSSSALLRPKAITSPVKSVPPSSIEMGMSTPPPLLSPLLSPSGAQVGWTKHTGDMSSPSHAGFIPLAPSLTSPTSTLPFSSLGKPHKSAFQIVSPRIDHTSDHTHQTDIRNTNDSTV